MRPACGDEGRRMEGQQAATTSALSHWQDEKAFCDERIGEFVRRLKGVCEGPTRHTAPGTTRRAAAPVTHPTMLATKWRRNQRVEEMSDLRTRCQMNGVMMSLSVTNIAARAMRNATPCSVGVRMCDGLVLWRKPCLMNKMRPFRRAAGTAAASSTPTLTPSPVHIGV